MATKDERPPLTRDKFHRLLRRASQPVGAEEPDPSKSETSEPHRSDGCTGTRKSPDNLEGTSE